MTPEFVDRPGMLLAGDMSCDINVSEIDVHALWQIYELDESAIQNCFDGLLHELDIGNGWGHGIYSVIAGAKAYALSE